MRSLPRATADALASDTSSRAELRLPGIVGRARHPVLAAQLRHHRTTASASFRMPMICSSENCFRFIPSVPPRAVSSSRWMKKRGARQDRPLRLWSSDQARRQRGRQFITCLNRADDHAHGRSQRTLNLVSRSVSVYAAVTEGYGQAATSGGMAHVVTNGPSMGQEESNRLRATRAVAGRLPSCWCWHWWRWSCRRSWDGSGPRSRRRRCSMRRI